MPTGRGVGPARSCRADADFVEGDPVRLEQALNNLVDNALTYGTGEVEIYADGEKRRGRAACRGPRVWVRRGLLNRAFDRFSRADEARGRAGAGLGLSIVQLIADVHGGSVGAANRPDGGADVWLDARALCAEARTGVGAHRLSHIVVPP